MTELEDFHRDFLPRFIDAQRDFHAGDAEPNIALWSTADPVTLFAVRGMRDVGSEALTDTFRRVASRFTDVDGYRWDLIASGVSGDSAYTVCIEHYTASVKGGPPERFEVRSTHVFRREDGRWFAVHRHADRQPLGQPDWQSRCRATTGRTPAPRCCWTRAAWAFGLCLLSATRP